MKNVKTETWIALGFILLVAGVLANSVVASMTWQDVLTYSKSLIWQNEPEQVELVEVDTTQPQVITAASLTGQVETVTLELLHGINEFQSLEVAWSEDDEPPDFHFTLVIDTELRNPTTGDVVATQQITTTDFIWLSEAITDTTAITPTVGATIDIQWPYTLSFFGKLDMYSKICFVPSDNIEIWYKDNLTGEYKLIGPDSLCARSLNYPIINGMTYDTTLTWPKLQQILLPIIYKDSKQ